MRLLVLSTARNVVVFLVDSTDHVTGKTGMAASLTITESKNGAAFASTTPTVTERGNGWYSIALTATNTNTLGDYALHITASGADPIDVAMQVVALNVADAVRAGLTALPNANAGVATGLPIVHASSGGGGILLGSGGQPQSNVTLWQGSAPANLSSSNVQVSVAAMQTDVVSAAALAASAVTEMQTGLATAVNLATVAGYLDTEIAAIKAKTDNLPNDTATELAIVTNRLPDELVGGRMNAHVEAIDTSIIESIQAGLATPATTWAHVLDANAPVNARTALQVLNICAAVLAGKVIATDDTVTHRDLGDTKNRVVGTVDGDEREPATLDGG